MQNKILLPTVMGLGIVFVLLGITFSQPTVEPILREPMGYEELNLSYVDSNSILKSSLMSNGILMSSPLKFTGDSIAQYCTFYQDEIKQNSITYCTSTELKDSEGKFLGNIHMVGTLDSPNAVLGVVQTDPNLSNLDSLKITYQIMINSLVCDCWQDKKPGNFESVSQWIDAAKSYHLEAKRTTSSSEISGLADKQLFLEITTNSEGYLWKLIISN
ncbi:MAG: hypothetical protein RI100_05245 [Nitrosarchaeum sp.]|jgi:hypothetical protein|uniref:hypothetical protein n=1 Tax=Nitrosarchaeum sp. TaxID=2026886 RepID=UPI002DE711C0|nr:hypothetical protein [Nitrosarchaeum sp.]